MKATIQDEWPEVASYCWGCGKNNDHGLQLKSYWDEEEVVATFIPKEHHLAFPGILNGGIIATIIDCHGTGTANAYGHKMTESETGDHFMYVTGSIFVKYLRPTPLDKPVILRAKVDKVEGNRITVKCSLYSDETLCATGEILTVRVDTERFVGK
ncbi:MAG: PaaI family thioesterase [Candidatus Thorarchaeota archaeon]|jgi:acyl-coenzyme A thioesterase PaaI-like protein